MVMSAEELRAQGDWIAELRRILQQGPAADRDANGPQGKRRSTKAAVSLVLDSLTKGAALARDQDTSEQDIRKVVFNAVDRLVADKVSLSTKGKDLQQALDGFEARLRTAVASRAGKSDAVDPEFEVMLHEAIQAIRFDERKKAYEAGGGTPDERRDFRRSMITSPEGLLAIAVNPAFGSSVIEEMAQNDLAQWQDPARAQDPKFVASLRKIHRSGSPAAKALIAQRMLGRADGCTALVANPVFGGELLADCDAAALQAMDLDQMFGPGKAAVAAEGTLALVNSTLPDKFGISHRQLDPAQLHQLTQAVDADTWNDEGTHRRGLGARVGQALWKAKQYDEIVSLIDGGMDTSLAARADGETGRGVYSGFVQPLQHVLSKLLRDVDAVDQAKAENEARCDALRKELVPRMAELQDALPKKKLGWALALADANALANGGDPVAALQALKALAKEVATAGSKIRAPSDEQTRQQQSYETRIAPFDAPPAKHDLGTRATPPDIAGVKKIYEALLAKGEDAPGGPISLTTWAEVKGSDMIAAFEAEAGTIWGFEDIRMPFVQAAHESNVELQREAGPLRMMEIWDAVKPSFPPAAYEQLLTDPPAAAKVFVDMALKGDGLKRFLAEAADLAEFKRNFEIDATAFLLEFAARIPKGLQGGDFTDVTGRTTQRSGETVRMSDVSGVGSSGEQSYLASVACKVGLWLAKEQDKPVYYCLDGVNMDDVINYKEVKNRAIAQFIDSGGLAENAPGFREVVTMQEVREILRNWDELKRQNGDNLVRFFIKGVEITGDELDTKVQKWRQAMIDANTRAGRAKAPPKATFSAQLQALDKRLLTDIPDTEEGDKDARDLVRKSGYLMKVAKTRPAILLKYLINRCAVLETYRLLSPQLKTAAAAFAQPPVGADLPRLRKALAREIKNCHASFRVPLTATLLTAVEQARAGI